MSHVFLNILVTKLRSDQAFKHIAFIGNRYLPALTKSYFSYLTFPVFKDVSGLTVYKCTFKHGVASVINVQGNPWETTQKRPQDL
ncbi:hypothetical protein TVAG_021280 [Trichomonas vaginalis G3]|uniref:Uncharacterized protein n=1 Tax=Trichomonas vaginalis (strain ATCC PRA-98 / G3) TaxID=412133 RepID=A2DHB0_TRIV3|nr:hypothetical protein TVAGG3_0677700 [Trichomonas vaginalis G3]XP_051112193.1 hypothetical protein TVAGG3_0227050 [Trichomonas vaginalis G3]EAY20183.1 hypothetical protein TVAG_021280 [Trichomonas vaginalis G3]KAI5507662.1 hypothetical protein TVAGG3_0677700 [Trichomonas vaginalis G3]KAI5552338.1 hypothetical protein TVAGG3_0227050 [Trichomonas vaginalis G3]|eukprot:XP_001581169.1 hypothetical protein [Trichomonas vaginalis G3]